MENITIAVVSADEDYNRVFCLSLLDACRQINVTAFTTREFVLQWAEYKGQGTFYDRFDLILWAGDEIRDSYGGNIVYLTDRTSLVNTDHDKSRYALYKYSRADAIVAAVFDIYSHLTGRQAMIVKSNTVRLFAFASYCGGAGCTTVTRAVCQELARFRSKKVLYLSMEDVESSADYLAAETGNPPWGIQSEGEFLYRLLSKNTLPFLQPYMVRDAFGVCSFSPPAGKNPLRDLSGEDAQRLLAFLVESAEFDVIAADLSTSLSEGALTFIEAAERVCVIRRTNELRMREKNYLNQLERSCGEAISNKIIKVSKPECACGRPEQPGTPSAPLEGEFGKEISKLTENLLDVVK